MLSYKSASRPLLRSAALSSVRGFSVSAASSNKNDNSKLPDSKSAATTTKKSGKISLNSDKKFSKFIREFNRSASSLSSDPGAITRATVAPTSASNKRDTYNGGAAAQYKLPRVPNTSHLDMRKFRQDILYSGYRPLLLPIKDDANLTFRFDKSGYMKKSSLQVASRPAPNNIWNNSALGTERFPEMDNIPYSVVSKLRPFERPSLPGQQKEKSTEQLLKKKEKNREVDWKTFFSDRGYKD